jgi:hypothetical protein
MNITIRFYKAKINFIIARLCELLKTCPFRVRYHLRQIVIASLFRMALSIIGEPIIHRAEVFGCVLQD